MSVTVRVCSEAQERDSRMVVSFFVISRKGAPAGREPTRPFTRHVRLVRTSPSTRNSPGTSTCHRSTSRPYHSCRCSLFARTCDGNQPQNPLQVTFGSQVIFHLKSSSGRRRNKAPPPARRRRDRAFRGARSTFRPSVPDFQTITSQKTTKRHRRGQRRDAHVFLAMPDPPLRRHARRVRASLA